MNKQKIQKDNQDVDFGATVPGFVTHFIILKTITLLFKSSFN